MEDLGLAELREGSTILCRLPDEGTDDDCAKFLSQLAEELGLTTSSVLFERCFLLVEGESEKAAFPRLFRLVMGQRMQEAGIVPFESGGNSTVLKLVGHLREMGKPVYVLVDKDSKTESAEDFRRGGARESTAYQTIISTISVIPTSSRSSFPTNNGQLLLRIRSWPREDGTEWVPHQIRALRGAGKFSDETHRPSEKQELSENIRKPRLVARLAETLNPSRRGTARPHH